MTATAAAIEWSEIDTVLVDMDGTLLDLAFDNFFWLDLVPTHYAERHGVPHSTALEQLSSRFDSAAGTLSWYCLDHWTRELGLDLRSLKRSHKHLVRFLPGAREFLDAVRARGKQLWIVTNAHRDTFAVKAEQTGIDRLVDRVVCSHDFDAPKEHAAFWHALERRQPFDRRRALFIDDSLAVLEAARGWGVRHLRAIRRPDSGRPARSVEDFPAIDGVAELV
jgi:putative hydrolase of the HAD superfamily